MQAYLSHLSGTLAELGVVHENTASGHMGIRIVAVGPDFLAGEMPVDERTRQPYGIVHGGAFIMLAETLGSMASHLLVAGQGGQAAGVEVSGSHVKSIRDGHVSGVCRPLRIGRNLHFWRIEIRDGEGALACAARLTVKILWPRPESGG